MQIIESILGTALLGFAAIAFMEVAEQRIHERDAIAAAEDVRAVQAAVIQHHRRNPHDTISDWITGGYPPCPAGYTGTGTDGQCRRDVTATNPYCPNGNLANWQGQTRCTLWTYAACPPDMSKLQNQWCVGRPFYHYSCDAQDTHHGVQTAIGMGMGMGTNALPGGNPWCERALEIPWKDLRDVAPERLNALQFEERLFHGLHRSPYGSEYKLMTDGVTDALRLEFEVTGLDEMARLMYGDRLPGKQVDVEPRPDATVHGEDTVFTVGVEITPGLANAFSKYTLDAVDRGADGTEGKLESPLYWADTRLDDGVTETVPGGDCSRFGNGAIEVSANGQVLICRALTPGGPLTWKPAHTIDSNARLSLPNIAECTGAPGEVPIEVPKAAIDAATGTPKTAPEINVVTGQLVFKDALGGVVHTVSADTWLATSATQGTACLKESGTTTTCHDGSTPPCDPRQPPACTGATGESPLGLSKGDYDTLTTTAHTWKWGTGADNHAVIATADVGGTELLRVSRAAWNHAVSNIGTGGNLCLKEAPPRTCPDGHVMDEQTKRCKPERPVCDFDGDGNSNLTQFNTELEVLKFFLGLPNTATPYTLYPGYTTAYPHNDPWISGAYIASGGVYLGWLEMKCFNKPDGTPDVHTRTQMITPLLDSTDPNYNKQGYVRYDATLTEFMNGTLNMMSYDTRPAYYTWNPPTYHPAAWRLWKY